MPPTDRPSLRNTDDPDGRDFWDFVRRSVEQWREQQPSWSRELERDEKKEPTDATD